MSDTPRTDALIDGFCPFLESKLTIALEEHARQLERRLDVTIEVYNRALDDKAKLERENKKLRERLDGIGAPIHSNSDSNS